MKTIKLLTFLRKPVVLFSMASAALLMSCNNDDEPVTPQGPLPDGEALTASHSEQLKDATESFTIDAEEGGQRTSKSGKSTLILFPNTLVDADGNEITGEVDLEFIEIFGRADMLLSNKPTMGRKEDGTMATLISGGEFYINATQDGEQVFIKENMGYQLRVNTDSLDTEMRLFTNANDDCDGADCDVIWEEDKGRGGIEAGGPQDGSGADGEYAGTYYAFLNDFGWTNLDKWYSSELPKTTVFVDVPEGYDDTNSAVYLTYDGEPTALARFDIYFEESGLFSEHYGQMPIGMDVHFIVVSMVDDQYYYAVQGATITEDHIEVMGDLTPTTEAELTQIINDLP